RSSASASFAPAVAVIAGVLDVAPSVIDLVGQLGAGAAATAAIVMPEASAPSSSSSPPYPR
ncbi:MAG: hypothetical protein ACT4P4_25755, partial [Betaproteobacteria bacterium]